MDSKRGQKKRANINFRQTHSERSATASYRAFGKRQIFRRKSF